MATPSNSVDYGYDRLENDNGGNRLSRRMDRTTTPDAGGTENAAAGDQRPPRQSSAALNLPTPTLEWRVQNGGDPNVTRPPRPGGHELSDDFGFSNSFLPDPNDGVIVSGRTMNHSQYNSSNHGSRLVSTSAHRNINISPPAVVHEKRPESVIIRQDTPGAGLDNLITKTEVRGKGKLDRHIANTSPRNSPDGMGASSFHSVDTSRNEDVERGQGSGGDGDWNGQGFPADDQTASDHFDGDMSRSSRRRSGTSHSSSSDGSAILTPRETRIVSYLRVSIVVILVLAAFAISGITYNTSVSSEMNEFKAAYRETCSRIEKDTRAAIRQVAGAVDAFASDAGTFARVTNQSWPFVTLPEFDARALQTSHLAAFALLSISVAPLVTNESQKERYEQYVQQHYHGAVAQPPNPPLRSYPLLHFISEEVQLGQLDATERILLEEEKIPDHIYNGTTGMPVTGSGPFAPLWQTAILEDVHGKSHNGNRSGLAAILNLDLLTLPRFKSAIQWTLDHAAGAMGQMINLPHEKFAQNEGESPLYFGQPTQRESASSGPITPLFYPVFDSFNQDKRVVAIVPALLSWRSFLHASLLAPSKVEQPNMLVAVISTDAGQIVSFDVNRSGGDKSIVFLGNGDMHDTSVDSLSCQSTLLLETESDLLESSLVSPTYFGLHAGKPDATQSSAQSKRHFRTYTMTVYPKSAMRKQYATARPGSCTLLVLLVFAVAIGLFVAYDVMVEHRQKLVSFLALGLVISKSKKILTCSRLFEGHGPCPGIIGHR
jgi:hypothetical protein